MALEVRITLKTIGSLTYNCTDEHTDALVELSTKLKDIVSEFKIALPHTDGLLLRPHLRKKAKLSLQRKTSLGARSLPQPLKRGRKKQDSKYRNRVGKRAQHLRKVQDTMFACTYSVPPLNMATPFGLRNIL